MRALWSPVCAVLCVLCWGGVGCGGSGDGGGVDRGAVWVDVIAAGDDGGEVTAVDEGEVQDRGVGEDADPGLDPAGAVDPGERVDRGEDAGDPRVVDPGVPDVEDAGERDAGDPGAVDPGADAVDPGVPVDRGMVDEGVDPGVQDEGVSEPDDGGSSVDEGVDAGDPGGPGDDGGPADDGGAADPGAADDGGAVDPGAAGDGDDGGTSACPVIERERSRPAWGYGCDEIGARRRLGEPFFSRTSAYVVCEDEDGDGCPLWSPPRACPGNGDALADGSCVCTPVCDGRECGGDDCGGVCGEMGGGCPGELSCMGGVCVDVEEVPEGEILWERWIGGTLSPVAVADDGRIYVTDNGSLWGLNPDGSIALHLTTIVGPFGVSDWDCEVTTAVMIGDDGTLYVGCAGEQHPGLLAVTPEGRVKWQHLTTWPVRESGALGFGGEVYFCDGGQGLRALGPDGEEMWRVEGACAHGLAPAIAASGKAMVAGLLLDAEDGNALQPLSDVEFGGRSAIGPRRFANSGMLQGVGRSVFFHARAGELAEWWPVDRATWVPTLHGDGSGYALMRDVGVVRFQAGHTIETAVELELFGVNELGVTIAPSGVMYGGAHTLERQFTFAFDESGLLWSHDGEAAIVAVYSPTSVVWAEESKVRLCRSNTEGVADHPWPRLRGDRRNTARER